jgi:hypothetical protein
LRGKEPRRLLEVMFIDKDDPGGAKQNQNRKPANVRYRLTYSSIT